MRAGLVAAIAVIIISVLLIGFNYYLISSAGEYYPKLMVLGFGFFGFGLFVLFFPGAKMSFAEMRQHPSKGRGGPLWVNAPMLHKVMWIVGIVIGVAIGIYVMVDLEQGGPILEFMRGN